MCTKKYFDLRTGLNYRVAALLKKNRKLKNELNEQQMTPKYVWHNKLLKIHIKNFKLFLITTVSSRTADRTTLEPA